MLSGPISGLVVSMAAMKVTVGIIAYNRVEQKVEMMYLWLVKNGKKDCFLAFFMMRILQNLCFRLKKDLIQPNYNQNQYHRPKKCNPHH